MYHAPIRLPHYDYSQAGFYFVTSVTAGRKNLFGAVVNGEVALSGCGAIVRSCLHDLASHYIGASLDCWTIMPNHVHAIIVIEDRLFRGKPADDQRKAGLKPAATAEQATSLPELVRALKTFSAREINRLRGTPGKEVWQRTYYERVIRDERELNSIREYIELNPSRWAEDEENGRADGRWV